jgi:DNA replication protein DnaC
MLRYLGVAAEGEPGLVRTMVEVCGLCEGSGLRLVEEAGAMVARPCECRVERRVARMLERARIPKRYENCTVGNYASGRPGDDRTLARAHLQAKKFVELYYDHKAAGTGLLLTGSIGVGKSHLAVGILKELIQERGVQGIFWDYRELLKEVQNSYNPSVAATELQVLRPVFEAEVLVLDELGASKPTEWVWDTVAHILNTRYNDRKITIITTNYSNRGPLGRESVAGKEPQADTAAGKAARAAMKDETLGDRIGERMRSRLQEMCVVVEVYGKDFRQNVKRASFESTTAQPITMPSLQPAAEDGGPTLTDLLLSGRGVIGTIVAGAEPTQEKPSVTSSRLEPRKIVATPAVPIQVEERDPGLKRVWVNGEWQPMITQPESYLESPADADRAPVGRAKMGKHATQSPKRIVETDWKTR